MKKFTIGQKVMIGTINVTGTVVAIEPDNFGYRVEFKKRNGKMVRRLFISEELLPIEGAAVNDEVAAQNASAALSEAPQTGSAA